MKKVLLVFLMTLLFGIVTLQADRGLKLQKMKEEQRVALVIGNTNYSNLSILKNPINDARAMKNVLQNRGFEVIYKENASKREMKKLLKKFAHKLKRGGVGLYYFAGHGVSVDGRNYLVGTDSLMDDKDEVEYETLALNYVTKKMKDASNRLNIVILDACRNDPFSRSGGGGLAPVSNARGMLVAYATEAGSVASDGKSGKNGVFTRYLVKNMKEKGATIERVFKNTRADVYDATNGKQSPGVYNQIRGDFYFTLPTSTYKNKQVNKKQVVVLDSLMWQDNEDAKTVKKDWLGAKKYCENLIFSDFNDWYLPNKQDLLSIIDKNNIPKIRVEFKNVATIYWSSSESLNNTEQAYNVFFKDAKSYVSPKNNELYVRCVRDTSKSNLIGVWQFTREDGYQDNFQFFKSNKVRSTNGSIHSYKINNSIIKIYYKNKLTHKGKILSNEINSIDNIGFWNKWSAKKLDSNPNTKYDLYQVCTIASRTTKWYCVNKGQNNICIGSKPWINTTSTDIDVCKQQCQDLELMHKSETNPKRKVFCMEK